MRKVVSVVAGAVLALSCDVSQKETAKAADACVQAADCAGKGLTKGPCAGAWGCTGGACDWQCTGASAKGWCAKPADCVGQGLSRPACDGAWTCESNVCGFACIPGGLDGGAAPGCVCPATWAPVCGADGKTWPNSDCAACGGATVAYQGECRACRPIEPPPACDDGVYESVDDGNGCPLGLQCVSCGCPAGGGSVCGADGKTYASACHASCAGISTTKSGACEAACVADADCPPGEVCAVQADCPTAATCAATCAKPPACRTDPDCGVAAKDCACGAACVTGKCYDLCWQCGGGGLACSSDADCANAGLPQQDCQTSPGSWVCKDGACEWVCAPGPGTCSSTYDPATGKTCTTCVDDKGNVTSTTCG